MGMDRGSEWRACEAEGRAGVEPNGQGELAKPKAEPGWTAARGGELAKPKAEPGWTAARGGELAKPKAEPGWTAARGGEPAKPKDESAGTRLQAGGVGGGAPTSRDEGAQKGTEADPVRAFREHRSASASVRRQGLEPRTR
ncbi:hypothetical protein GCM10023205_59670 [Yinghuangia aomiensis]|uniref:Uncharacterized protein n=1 Tax=Yinghuangia aomiensis TaxID=676205 RepID=A0ABP9HZ73_9ACTN